jgi:hypothetical protein
LRDGAFAVVKDGQAGSPSQAHAATAPPKLAKRNSRRMPRRSGAEAGTRRIAESGGKVDRNGPDPAQSSRHREEGPPVLRMEYGGRRL